MKLVVVSSALLALASGCGAADVIVYGSTAAVLPLTDGAAVQDVDYSSLRSRLLRDGQVVAVSLVPAKESVPK